MDTGSVGLSLYTGSLEPQDGIGGDDHTEDEEEAEEERQRQQEMQGLLANAFDDLEDSELQQSSYYPPGVDHTDDAQQNGHNYLNVCKNDRGGQHFIDADANVPQNGQNFGPTDTYGRQTDANVDDFDGTDNDGQRFQYDAAGGRAENTAVNGAHLYARFVADVHRTRNDARNDGRALNQIRQTNRLTQNNAVQAVNGNFDRIPDINQEMNLESHEQLGYQRPLDNQNAIYENFQHYRAPEISDEFGRDDNYTGETERSVTPLSDRSNSITSSNYNQVHEDGVNLEGMRLNLRESDAYDDQFPTTDRVIQEEVGERKNSYDRQYSSPDRDLQQDILSADTPYDQLQLLYQARGRELDKMAAEIEQLRAEKLQQVAALQHEVTLLKGEKERLELSRSQSHVLLSEKENQLRSLRTDHQKSQDELNQVKAERTKLQLKLETSESLIKTMEQNISDLQSVDSLAKHRQMHEDFLSKLQRSHRDELNALQAKLSNAQHSLQEEKHRFAELKAEVQLNRERHDCIVLEKSRLIKELQGSLEASQQQCDALLAASKGTGSVPELREQVEALSEDKQQLETELRLAKAKLEERKEDLEYYDTALKLGVLASILPTDDSIAQLRLGGAKHLTYEDSVEVDRSEKDKSCLPDAELVNKLKGELQHALHVIKRKRDHLNDLDKELGEQTRTVRKLRAQLKSSKVDIDEHVSTIKVLTNDKNNILDELAEVRPKCLSLRNENSSLKEELTSALRQISMLLRSSTALSNVVKTLQDAPTSNGISPEELNTLTSLLADHRNAVQRVDQVNQALWTELREENAKLAKDKFVWTENVCELIATLDSIKVKVHEMRGGVDANLLRALNEVFDEFKRHASKVRAEQAALIEKCTVAQNELWTVKLSLQKLEFNEASNRDRIQELTEELANERLNRKQLSEASLETCKQTYLNFHEDAIARVKKEFSDVRGRLEEQIDSLTKELTDVKARFVALCKEKNELEKQLDGDCDSGFNSDRLKFAVKEIVAKYEREITMLRENHRKEIESIAKPKDVCDSEVQTDKCPEIAESTSTGESNGSSARSINSSSAQELEEILSDGEVVERSQMVVKHLGSQLNSINNKVSDLIVGIQEGQVAETEQITHSLEAFRKELLALERQMFPMLTPDGGYALPDIDDSYVRETAEGIISEYKNAVTKLKREKKELQDSYEERVHQLLEQVKLVTESNEKMLGEMLNLNKNQGDTGRFENMNSLTDSIMSLRQKIEEISHNETVISKLSDDLMSLQAEFKELTHARNLDQLRFYQELSCLKQNKTKAKQEITRLKQELAEEKEASLAAKAKLKDKFGRLNANFAKLRKGSEDRINHYLREAERVQREGDEGRLALLKCFEVWLQRTKNALEEGICLIIRSCEEMQKRLADCKKPQESQEILRIARSVLKKLAELRVDESLLQPQEDEQ